MSRVLCGPGSRGDLACTLQKALVTAGLPLQKVDEIYGNDTAKAIRDFQRQSNLAATGIVDDTTWTVLTRLPAPALFERCMQLTAAFEGHNYTLAVGNFDGAGLTWGIIGFTLSNGEVQSLLNALDAANPEWIDSAFGAAAGGLRQMLRSPLAEQKAWAQRHTVTGGGLAEPWKTGFAALGNLTPVREAQRRKARRDYYEPALRTAQRKAMASELGIALAFDIHVQNGSIKDAAAQSIARQLGQLPNATERVRREIIANAVADAAKPEFREDVRSRKLTIARGAGTVHGRLYALENWGLAEMPAVQVNA